MQFLWHIEGLRMIYKTGEQIYKYKLINYIGGGNFGEVWLAEDISLNSTCALKLLPKNDTTIDERLLEAKIGNRLQHPNVVNIKYADVINQAQSPVVAIAMPFYSNGSILSQLNSGNFLSTKTTIKCLIDVLRGLEYLHENGYYHCDIKPNNILVGDNYEYILSDYGITCYSPNQEAVHPRQCYLPHTSPETIENDVYDVRTDIYQLGLTAFRLLNGISEIRCDFDRDRNQFKENIKSGKVVTDNKFQPFIPRKIRRIINKAIELNPDERYQSALEMRRALEQLALRGDCTTDASGNVVIISNDKAYRYEIEPISEKTSNFTVYQKNLKSNRETRVSAYTIKGIKNSEIKKKILSLVSDLI